MVNSSKILTVSYGTFSCTLEGFDDSFDMMKAIAEYFRDLAADDRYFGAEPPTPDAEMLARIAEREVSRRVEARQERGAIVLRPSEEPAVPVAQSEPQAPAAPSVTGAATPAEPAGHLPPQQDESAEEVAADIASELAPAAEIQVETPPPSTSPQDEEDSVAAKLSRIRAVVSRSTPVTEDTPAYTEDEHAEDFSGDSAASIAAALREEIKADELTEEEDDSFDLTAETVDTDEQPVDDPQLAADIAESASDPNQRARVIRMKRADFDAAIAAGALTEEEDAEEDTPTTAEGLSPEDEADLMRELAEVEAELNLATGMDADDEEEDEEDDLSSIFAADEEEDEDEEEHAPRSAAPDAESAQPKPARAETDVSRLMEKARTEMDRPEGAHRRSAIAHLRAAVQATRAESEAGGGLNRDDGDLDVYRDDLNSVVRPRRPRTATPDAADADMPRRPASKPAPLKLVAEQRIDAPAAPQPVRPRRVSVADVQEEPVAQAEENSGFAEFAEQAGVKNLAELMEAAAAYMSYVEGRQKFSRPQLMNKARQVEDYQFSREDGLRSFGQLLRQGKIEKLKGGRFTVSEELIGFKPDDRAAG
ncbi:hypothetical protein [Thalassovita sp.]|uniref:hypothetical protein n=1 Tax=Thalassovita sp. TaxID=1979401 RepID=UPI0029DE800A|nr:hypothetical protein [Thalassovita sp.]